MPPTQFDPDAFMATQAAGGFDPDKFMATQPSPNYIGVGKGKNLGSALTVPQVPVLGVPKTATPFVKDLSPVGGKLPGGIPPTMADRAARLLDIPTEGVTQGMAGVARMVDGTAPKVGDRAPNGDTFAGTGDSMNPAQKADFPESSSTYQPPEGQPLPPWIYSPGITPAQRRERTNKRMGAVSDVIEGAGKAASPALIPAAVANPVGTAVALGGATVGGAVAGGGAALAGGSPEAQRLVGDTGAILGGVGLTKGLNRYRANVQAAITDAPHEILPKAQLVPKQGIKDLGNVMEHTQEAAGQRITSANQYAAALETLRKNTLDKLNQWFYGPAQRMGTQISTHTVPQAVAAQLPGEFRAGEYGPYLQELQNEYANKNWTPDALHARLTRLDSEADALHNGDPVSQATAALKGTTPAMLEAEAAAIRGVLYPAIDLAPAPGTVPGEGPAQAGRLLADTIRLQKQFSRRQQIINNEKPSSELEAVGKQAAAVANVPGKFLHGDTGGALEGAKVALHGTTDPMVEKAFANVGPVSKPLVNPGIGMRRLGMPGMPGAGYPPTQAPPMPQGPQGFAAVGHPMTPQGPPLLNAPNMPIGASGVTMPGSNASQLRTQVATQPLRLGGATPGMPVPNEAGPFAAGQPAPTGGGSTVTGPGQPPPLPQLPGPSQIQQHGEIPVPQSTAVDRFGATRPRGPMPEMPSKAVHRGASETELIPVRDKATGRTLHVKRSDAEENPSYEPIGGSLGGPGQGSLVRDPWTGKLVPFKPKD